jgi:hypothetical protein
MATKRIGLRQIRALRPGEVVWDPKLSGFGARRQRSDTVSYVLFFRTKEGRQRWFTIGKHGSPWTPESARAEARRLLGDVERRIDPAVEKQKARNAETVAELCNEYLAAAEAGRILKRDGKSKKSSTINLDKGRVERHIKPLLGRHKVAAITRRDIESEKKFLIQMISQTKFRQQESRPSCQFGPRLKELM